MATVPLVQVEVNLGVALMFADLEASDEIGPPQFAEAVQLRRAAGAFRAAPAP